MTYTAFTTNLCENSSFETGLAGWTSVSGTTLVQTTQDAVAGRYSMLVETLGSIVGEGVYGPQAELLSDVTGSVGVSLWGESGTLTVSAVVNPDGIVLAQQVVHLNGRWQRVTINGLSIAATQSVYILIQTSGSAQALSFLVDAVQYEPESPAHPYIDGSFDGCDWLGTPFASASEQPGQFSISLRGGTVTEGSIKVTIAGEVFQFALPAGEVISGGSITVATVSPVAAFDDFAIFKSTDPDPAMTYAGWNTASLLSGRSSYSRPWAIFYPPVDYPASDGSLMWPRAAFMGMGIEFTGVASGVAQNLTSAQVEMMPLAGDSGLDIQPAPSAYDTPRAIHLIVKPARLNYSTNPAFAVSLSGWSQFGGATLTRDSTVAFGVLGGYDGVFYSPGYSMKVVSPSVSSGAQITLPDLIAGDIYTASIYVLPTAGMVDVQLQVGSTIGGVPGADGVTPLQTLEAEGVFGSGTFDSGMFGGFNPAEADWVRSQVTFAAMSSTVTLQVSPVMEDDSSSEEAYGIDGYGAGGYGGSTPVAALPVPFWCAANMVEAGEIAGKYFDGSVGNPDYMWEGTPGLSRSYYYPNYLAGQKVVSDILASHTPMSISAAEAVYLQVPSQ